MATQMHLLPPNPHRRWIPWWTAMGALLLAGAMPALSVLFHPAAYGRLNVEQAEAVLKVIGIRHQVATFPAPLVAVMIEQMGTLLVCLVAGLLAWKKPEREEVRLLALFLCLLGLVHGPTLTLLGETGVGMRAMVPGAFSLAIVLGTIFLHFTSRFPHRISPADLAAHYRRGREPGQAASTSRARPWRGIADALGRMRRRPLNPVDAGLIVLGSGTFLLSGGLNGTRGALQHLRLMTPERMESLLALRSVIALTTVLVLLALQGDVLLGMIRRPVPAGKLRRWAGRAAAVLIGGGMLATGILAVEILLEGTRVLRPGWRIALPALAAAAVAAEMAFAGGTAAGGKSPRERLPDRLVVLLFLAAVLGGPLLRIPASALLLLLPVIAARPLGRRGEAPWLRSWMLRPALLWGRAALWIVLTAASFALIPDGLWLFPVTAAATLVIVWAISGGVRNLRIGCALMPPANRPKVMWMVNGFAVIFWMLLLGVAPSALSPALIPEAVTSAWCDLLWAPILPVASLSVGMAVFYHGALDPGMVFSRTSLYSALGVGGVFLFAGIENLLQEGFARGLEIPPAAAPVVAGGIVALTVGALRARIGERLDGVVRRLLRPDGGRVVVVSMDFAELDRYGESDAQGAARLTRLLHVSARRAAGEHGGRLVERGRGRVLLEFEAAGPALAFVREVFAAVRAGSEPPRTADARLRAGVHAGEVIRDEEDALYGQAVAEAERLRERAAGGCVLVSPAVEAETGAGEREAAE